MKSAPVMSRPSFDTAAEFPKLPEPELRDEI